MRHHITIPQLKSCANSGVRMGGVNALQPERGQSNAYGFSNHIGVPINCRLGRNKNYPSPSRSVPFNQTCQTIGNMRYCN